MEEEQGHRESKKKGISRRDFLKTMFKGTAAVAGTAIIKESGLPIIEAQDNTRIESEVIDGLETFGSIENPLSQEQLNQLVEQLNSEEREMREDTLYGTQVVTAEMAQKIEDTVNESVPAFYKRLENRMNQMLQDSSKAIFELRRAIIVSEDVYPPNSRLLDSDGPYNGYYRVSDLRLDGRSITSEEIHEWGHYFLSLEDGYAADTYLEQMENIPQWIQELPEQYREYRTRDRNDVGKDIMYNANNEPYLSSYHSLRIKRRVETGVLHSDYEMDPNVEDLPQKFKISMEFNNQPVDISRVEIYRSQGKDNQLANYDQVFTETPTLESNSDTVSMKELYDDVDRIYPGVSTVFLKAYDTNGNSYGRWIDVDDIHYPALLYPEANNNNQTVRASMGCQKLDDPNIPPPDQFDWTINYSVSNS